MKNLITVSILFLTFFQSIGQDLWKSIQELDSYKESDKLRTITPDKYDLLELDYQSMTKLLAKASNENLDKSDLTTVDFELPLPEGNMITMRFVESPNMSSVLAAKFPEIKAYRGYNPENPGEHSRIDFGPSGFHAAITTNKGTVYIDPYYSDADEKYMSYYIKDDKLNTDQLSASCGVDHYIDEMAKEEELYVSPNTYSAPKKSVPVIRTTYRMALACTGRWGSIFGTPENVMARFNTGVNRLNSIFENEVGVNFQLIDNNDQLIFFNDTEPYSDPAVGRTVLRENTTVLNNTVGPNSYDIGHVFTTNCTDGIAGVAFGGSVCTGNKGAGVSCIGTSNVSNFVVRVIAHEVGHQFSGGHTWNNCPTVTQDQRSSSTGWEPASGSTILSYAGLCGPNNVQGPNDAYFHVGSINQFYDFIENAQCGIKEASDSNTPELFVDIPEDLVIPLSTPFELKGTAVDQDGDQLTYNWEQYDLGPESELGSPTGNAPAFISLDPGPNPNRMFPALGNILSGTNNVREVLPTYNRGLTFRFTVRDNHPGTGVTVWEQIELETSDTAGPFVVTSPSEITFVEVNEEFIVEWDVANTDNTIIDCQEVNIWLSTNGGGDFDVPLAMNVPNDGSHAVLIPNAITNSGRIRVEASNNVFFNIGRGTIVVRQPSAPGFFFDLSESDFEVCLPENVSVDIQGTSFQGFENEVTFDITSGLPPNASFQFSNNPMLPGESTSLTIDLSNVTDSGEFELVVEGSSPDASNIIQRIQLEITGTDMSDLSLSSPLSGTEGLTGTPEFEWTPAVNAETYTFEISTSPEFGPTSILVEEDLLLTTLIPQVILDNSTLYYWRVTGSNKCVEAFESEIFTLGTVSLNCTTYSDDNLPINISQSGLPSISSTIQIFDQGPIADINITKIDGRHGRARDLTGTIINPQGQEIELWSSACSGADFNLGFDDDSPILFGCPLNAGNVMQLEEGTLFDFIGEEMEGEWTLRLDDTRAGEGGRLDRFEIELCSDVVSDKPFLVNNNVLEVPTGGADRIVSDLLLSQDNNNSAEELLYTLVVNTTRGTLFFNGAELEVGSRFTQSEINSGALRYEHNGIEDETDSFTFTVIDGEGGFIDLTEFIINTDASFTSAVDELGSEDLFRVFPNPANNVLNIYNKEQNNADWNVTIFNIDGQVMHRQVITDKLALDVGAYTQGLYLVHLSDGKTFFTHKVNIIR